MCKFCILQYTRQIYYNCGITIIFCFQTRPGINRPATTKIKFESQNINVHIYHHQFLRTVGMNFEGQCMSMFSCMISGLLYFWYIDPFWAMHKVPTDDSPRFFLTVNGEKNKDQEQRVFGIAGTGRDMEYSVHATSTKFWGHDLGKHGQDFRITAYNT